MQLSGQIANVSPNGECTNRLRHGAIKFWLASVLLFLTVFTIHMMLSLQGIDLCDPGFFLTLQINAVDLRMHGDMGAMTYLTHLIGGLWLMLYGQPSLLWARLGGALLTGATAVTSWAVIATYFNRRNAFFAVLGTAIFIPVFGTMTIHHYSLPAFLLTMDLWLFNKWLNAKTASTRNLFAFLLGFVVVATVLSRIPLIATCVIPALVVAYYLARRMSLAPLKATGVFCLLGIVASIGFFGIVYSLIHYLPVFISSLCSPLAKQYGHPPGTLAKLHLYDWWIVAYRTVFLCLFMLISGILWEKIKHGRLGVVLVWLVLALIAFKAWTFWMMPIGLILLVTVVYLRHGGADSSRLALLLLASSVVMISIPQGSIIGLTRAKDGMWVALPLAVLVSQQLLDRTPSWIRYILRSAPAVMLCLVVGASLYVMRYPHREPQPYFTMRCASLTPFEDQSLRGIRSTPQRVSLIDHALKIIRQNTRPGDYTLMGVEVPLLYYLTATVPAPNIPWFMAVSLERTKYLVEESIAAGKFPEIVVLEKAETADEAWPETPLSPVDYARIDYLRSVYAGRLHYILIYEDLAFEFYKRPNGLGVPAVKSGSSHDPLPSVDPKTGETGKDIQ